MAWDACHEGRTSKLDGGLECHRSVQDRVRCCLVFFGERDFDFGGGQVVLVNYRKFLRHFDCSCHGITQTKTGRRPLTAGTTARSTREFAFCAR